MTSSSWQRQIAELQRSGFASFAGAHASFVLPIPDNIIGPAITERLPPTSPVREIEIHAHAANEFTARIQWRRPSVLPALQLRFRIDRQPVWPDSPVIGLLMAPGGLATFLGPAARLFNAFPNGVKVDGHRIYVDLPVVAGAYGSDLLRYVTRLNVTTEDGRVIVAGEGRIP